MTATETETRSAPLVAAQSMVHTYCACSPDVGLCGKRLVGPFVPGDPVECVVCAAMADQPCPTCGAFG